MPRYFLEVAYKGTAYSGFQVQQNANTVQAETEKALAVLYRQKINLTGASRTDAGVHALQNFFHFDLDLPVEKKQLYNLNALLPYDIAALNIYKAGPQSHCRFDAVSREYRYYIYQEKNPFLSDRAYYFPYQPDFDALQKAAAIVMEYNDFTSFSKRNTQVKTFLCNILRSEWKKENGCLVYTVAANRFLRGMVRGLTGTMLKVGRGLVTAAEFRNIIQSDDCTKADFSAPAHALFLTAIIYKDHLSPA